MSANFLSLPPAIFTNIWDYCGPKEILVLASTCRMLKTEIESGMLMVDAQHDCRLSQMIPIFFADQCHSVFMVYDASYCGSRINVSSRKRQQHEARDIVLERECCRMDNCQIAFRNDPSRQYQVWHHCKVDDDGFHYKVRLRKQFMAAAVTPAMKRAVYVCLNMGCYGRGVWYPNMQDSWKKHEMTRFFMKLFLLGCVSLSEESSPIRGCFESGEDAIDVDNTRICLIPQIISLFEQTLEQKEPNDCVKRPLSDEEMERYSWYRATDQRILLFAHTCYLRLCLKDEFTWTSCKRRHPDRDDDILFHDDELVFIARIPLAPNAARISLAANTKTDSPTSVYIIFFHKRESDLEDLENPIVAKVFTANRGFARYRTTFAVVPKYEACFLYYVPTGATRLGLTELDVCLDVGKDEHSVALSHWMDVLVDGRCGEAPSDYHRLLPIMLLRDGASALLGPDQELNKEWKNTFDMQGVDSTPEGLQCIVDVCDVLLEFSCEEV